MMKVDNKKVITALARREYRGNFRRNILTVIAVFLTTFLITAVCSMGVSYWNTLTNRNVRIEGMKYDIQLPEPTKEQVERAHGMKEILYAGLSVKCAVVEEYEGDPAKIRLYWSDDINWEKQCLPAFEFTEGTYPQKEEEVMLSTHTLKALGIDTPRIGMQLSFVYHDLSEKGGTHEKELTLSGYFRDYSGDSKGFVSKSFYEETGVKQTDLSQGRLNITLKNPIYSADDIERMGEKLELNENQLIFADYYLMDDFLKFASGLGLLFLLILVSGYLFIYNTLYISISKEIRFYGQLKTIGVTSTQMKRLIYLQVLWNSLIGIPVGILAGAGVSLAAVPAVLKLANPVLGEIQTITFQPIIFAGAALFSLFTVFISSRKPAVIAGDIAPIEATKYVSGKQKGKRKKTVNGGKLSAMARRNIFREKKQAVVILISFFVALTAFLTVNTLVEGTRAKKVLNRIYDYDLKVYNETVDEYKYTPEQKIQPSVLEQIAAMENVKSVRQVITARAVVPYEEAVFGGYFKRIYDSPLGFTTGTYEENLALYKKEPGNLLFAPRFVGIDEQGFGRINEEMGNRIDKEAFMSGEIGILKNFLGLNVEEAVGKEITYELPANQNKKQRKIKIAAELPKEIGGLNYFAGGYLPDIVVSDNLAKEVLDNPVTEIAYINYKEPFDRETDGEIKALFQNDAQITLEAKLDAYDEMKQSEDQMQILGLGLGLILAFLAILNYCNMVLTGIQNRRKEFATLQSIGMTAKQLQKVLALEGLGYGICSIAMTILVGIPVSFLVFASMDKYGVRYALPVTGTAIVLGIFLLVAIFVPPAAYQATQKESIIEQLRDQE